MSLPPKKPGGNCNIRIKRVLGDKMAKIDLEKENKELYNPSTKEVSIVDVPKMNFLMINGEGDPNTSQEYQDAMKTVFPVSYKTKFISKKEKLQDYVVMAASLARDIMRYT